METTIGEYVEALLLKDKYFNTPLPRIPMGLKRKLEERLAPMTQYRKRTRANHKVFGDIPRAINQTVEVCVNGVWKGGHAIEVDTRVPSRIKVRVDMPDGEVIAHIGRVVLR